MDYSISLLAIDIDGTLLDDKLAVSPRTINKLNELVDEGFNLSLVTGRVHRSANKIKEKLGLDASIISYNGAKVITSSGLELYNYMIPKYDARKIIEYGEKLDLYVKVYIDDVLYVKEDDIQSREFVKDHGIEYKVVGKLSDYINKDVNMIVIRYKDPFQGDHRDVFKDFNVSVTMSTPYTVEFVSQDASKGRGLELLSNYLNIDGNNILAIGNALNDFDMLQFAKIGIAMKNSDEKLLSVWDNISRYTNNEEGVYHIIKDLSY